MKKILLVGADYTLKLNVEDYETKIESIQEGSILMNVSGKKIPFYISKGRLYQNMKNNEHVLSLSEMDREVVLDRIVDYLMDYEDEDNISYLLEGTTDASNLELLLKDYYYNNNASISTSNTIKELLWSKYDDYTDEEIFEEFTRYLSTEIEVA